MMQWITLEPCRGRSLKRKKTTDETALRFAYHINFALSNNPNKHYKHAYLYWCQRGDGLCVHVAMNDIVDQGLQVLALSNKKDVGCSW